VPFRGENAAFFSAPNGPRYCFSGSLFSVSFVSIALVISSIGFGGGVVAMVQPIHAPMPITAVKAMNTGIAMTQNWALESH